MRRISRKPRKRLWKTLISQFRQITAISWNPSRKSLIGSKFIIEKCFCCIGKLKFNFRFPFVFIQLNLETKNNFLFYRIIAPFPAYKNFSLLKRFLFFCSKPFVYLCIVRKTTIKFNKTKNKF